MLTSKFPSHILDSLQVVGARILPLLGRVLGGNGAVPWVQDKLVARLGGARGARGARRAGGRVFGASHVGAEQQYDDGRVEHHDDGHEDGCLRGHL